ncbi:MAG: hypothetical protein Q7S52_00275 [bacterium]|nr:hypothetical protein [bacterium]
MAKRTLKIFIIVLLLDFLGAAAFWFGYSTIMAKKDEEAQLRAELVDEAKKASQQATLRRSLKQAERERGTLSKYFFDLGEESQIAFVAKIEALGLPISGTLVETGSFALTAGGTPSFRGEFALKGRWEEMYHFLRLIETFPGRLVIQRFSAQSVGGKDASWNGGISLELTSLKSN